MPLRAAAAGGGRPSCRSRCSGLEGGQLGLHTEQPGKGSLSVVAFLLLKTEPGLVGVCLQRNSQRFFVLYLLCKKI